MQTREPNFWTDRDLTQSSRRPPRISWHTTTPAEVDMHAAGDAPRMEKSRPRRKKIANKRAARRNVRIRRWATWLIGGPVAVLGFFVGLWLTGPATPPLTPDIMVLIKATVSDGASLMAAVQTAGLRGTQDVKGAIEGIKRLDDERVMIKGWVADTTVSDSPLTVVAFAGGKHVLTMATNGARLALARIFGLSEPKVANTSFQGTFACKAGKKIVVVAVTPDRTYSQFRSLVCP